MSGYWDMGLEKMTAGLADTTNELTMEHQDLDLLFGRLGLLIGA
jgi:hypothetical protein